MRFHHPRRAFTLIELLIVIVIIGLLTGLATTSYINAQKNARDNARKTSVSSISNAVEAFYQAKRRLPGLIGNEGAGNIPAPGQRTTWAGCLALDTDAGKSSVLYYSFPTNTSAAGGSDETLACSERALATGFIPSQFSPYPSWIPELGEYLNPAPLEKRYQNSTGTTSPLDNGGAYSVASHDPLGTSQATAFVYRRLVGGYMVYTRLENSTTGICPTAPTTPCTFSDTPKYSSSAGIPVDVTVHNNSVYMIRK
jgi:prepilin-type N-terminal cleavage/methylation domain-containing protein